MKKYIVTAFLIYIPALVSMNHSHLALSLCDAARTNNLSKARKCFAAGINPNEITLVEDYLPLQHAAFNNNSAMINLLILNRAKVNLLYKGGSALSCAALANNIDAARILIAHGADLNVGYPNNTPLFIAAKKGNAQLVKYFISLHSIEDAQEYVNQCNTRRYTPLHYAAAHGYLDLVRILVAAKASTKIKGFDGHTPLCLAKKYRHISVINYLEQVDK